MLIQEHFQIPQLKKFKNLRDSTTSDVLQQVSVRLHQGLSLNGPD